MASAVYCIIRGLLTDSEPENRSADMMKQILVAHAKRIALTYPTKHRARYIEAADTLRSPFWDWATDEAVPQATVPQQMSINVPSNGDVRQQDVENPLYTFKFPDAILDGEFGPFDHARRSQMYRCTEPNMSYPETANESIRRRGYKGMIVSHYG